MRYTNTEIARTILRARNYIIEQDQQRLIDAKYDIPCCSYEENISKTQFLIFAIENIDAFTTDTEKEKIISKLNRFARNSDSELDATAFLATDYVQNIIAKL